MTTATRGATASVRSGPRIAINDRTVLAVSGLVMLIYLVAHLGGNLLAFAGADAFNGYARWIREFGSPAIGAGVAVIVVRVVLAGALVAHVGAHVRSLIRPDLSPTIRDAPTPPRYAADPLPILLPSGGVILLFVAFHLAQLTFGATLPAFDAADPYRNLVMALGSWPVALGYIVVGAAVAAHLRTGVWTGMRSLGLNRRGSERLALVLSPVIAFVVFIGMAATPLAVALGVIR